MAEINLVPTEYREKRDRWKKVFSKTTFLVLFFIVITLLVYGGTIIYKKKLSDNLGSINQEIAALANKRVPDNENAIINLDAKIALLKEVFQIHTYWSKIFEKIEDLTMPNVYFSDVQLRQDAVGVSFQLSAITETYTSLAKQMLGFQRDPLTQKVQISGISLSEDGGIEFNLSVVFPLKTLMANGENKSTTIK